MLEELESLQNKYDFLLELRCYSQLLEQVSALKDYPDTLETEEKLRADIYLLVFSYCQKYIF